MSAIPFSKAADPYTRVWGEWKDGDLTLGDLTSTGVAALDILSWAMDPVGSIASAALGPLLDFIVENVAIFREALDFLAGDQGMIRDRSDAWMKVSNGLVEAANDHAKSAQDLATWNQSATDAYFKKMTEINTAFQSCSQQAANVSVGIQNLGMICAGVREFIWGMIKNFLVSVISNAIVALAAAVPTAGGSLGAFGTWFVGKMSGIMASITKKLADLAEKIAEASKRFTGFSQKMTEMASKMRMKSIENQMVTELSNSTARIQSATVSRRRNYADQMVLHNAKPHSFSEPEVPKGQVPYSKPNPVRPSDDFLGDHPYVNKGFDLADKARGNGKRMVAKPLDAIDKQSDKNAASRKNQPPRQPIQPVQRP